MPALPSRADAMKHRLVPWLHAPVCILAVWYVHWIVLHCCAGISMAHLMLGDTMIRTNCMHRVLRVCCRSREVHQL